jgi:hypothetical protein
MSYHFAAKRARVTAARLRINHPCPSCGAPSGHPCVAFSKWNPAPPPMKGLHRERKVSP